jgi:hypothetical protein
MVANCSSAAIRRRCPCRADQHRHDRTPARRIIITMDAGPGGAWLNANDAIPSLLAPEELLAWPSLCGLSHGTRHAGMS